MADDRYREERGSSTYSSEPYREGRERSGSIFGDDRQRGYRGQSDEERGFIDRAGDELRSWFGDEEANRRRERDFREDDRGWGGAMGPSEGSTRINRRFGRAEAQDFRGSGRGEIEPQWSPITGDYARGAGRQDWQDQRGFGRPDSARQAYGQEPGRGEPPRQDFTGSRGYRESHYGAEHGTGGYRGEYGQSGSGSYESRRSFGSQAFGRARDTQREARFASSMDEHYRSWRDRQLAELDHDYEEYRREREQQFQSDFDSWRRTRRGGTDELQLSGEDMAGSQSGNTAQQQQSGQQTAGEQHATGPSESADQQESQQPEQKTEATGRSRSTRSRER